MAIGRSCSIEYLAPAIVAETDTATAVERCVIGRRAINDVAVTRDSDGRLLAGLRAQPAADGSSHEQFADVRPDADSVPPEAPDGGSLVRESAE